MCNDSVEVISRLKRIVQVLLVEREIEVSERKGNMAADLGGEVCVKAKPLEMNTQHFWQTNYTHLLHAVLKAFRSKRDTCR